MDSMQEGLFGYSMQRTDKSLGILTQRFIELLQDAPDGVADLNAVCYKL